MAKKDKTPKVKVKKVRTPEEKAARKIRRKAKREANKEANALKTRIAKRETEAVAAVEVKKGTSDGLPFSISIDNPLSLRAQLAAAEAAKPIEAANEKAEALAKYRKKTFAGSAKEGILSINMA